MACLELQPNNSQFRYLIFSGVPIFFSSHYSHLLSALLSQFVVMEASEKSAIALLKAEQKAKRAMTRANNLREQQKLERELIEATEGQ